MTSELTARTDVVVVVEVAFTADFTLTHSHSLSPDVYFALAPRDRHTHTNTQIHYYIILYPPRLIMNITEQVAQKWTLNETTTNNALCTNVTLYVIRRSRILVF